MHTTFWNVGKVVNMEYYIVSMQYSILTTFPTFQNVVSGFALSALEYYSPINDLAIE